MSRAKVARSLSFLFASLASAGLASAEADAPPPSLPLGISRAIYELAVPDGPPNAATIALGDKLFNDKRLSADDTVACATCHDPKRGFVDHLATSEGIGKQVGKRNSPT